jgi:fucose permease
MQKIILIAILQSMTIASGILIPFFMGYGSSTSDIFLFTAVYQIAILLLEIPTGLIASKYGEKTSIIL